MCISENDRIGHIIFTYEISYHELKTSAADFEPLAFGTILTQHVPVPTG